MEFNRFKKVAVIMGGWSNEREISLLSGSKVLDSLKKSGVNAHKIDPCEDDVFGLVKNGYDCAVIMLHGRWGEDGSIQGVLEYMKIPYTGSGITASGLSLDKYRTKLLWREFGIPVPDYQYLIKNDYKKNIFELKIDFPLIIKPSHEGSTFGITKVYNTEGLYKAIDLAFEFGDFILIEKLILGGEYTTTIFDGEVYPIIKIEAVDGDYNYNNKYFTTDTNYICPCDLDSDLVAEINYYSSMAYNSVGAAGVARVDFMLNNRRKPFFLEINTLPGMTEHSLVPMAFREMGQSFDELCLKILNGAKLHIR